MILEDNPSIRESYCSVLKDVAKRNFNTTAYIESFGSFDEAVKRLINPNQHSFDLFFTDIDLAGSPTPDKAGLDFAKFAKIILPDVPVVGCSGYFVDSDLSDPEIRLFDRWWPKGSAIAQLNQMFDDVMARAIEHKNRSLKTDGDKPLKLATETITTPVSDEDFCIDGYQQKTIEPTAQNGYIKPFCVWVKESDEGCELEVLGCSALMAWGDDFMQAVAVLDELIEGYKELLDEPDDALSASMLQARNFVKQIVACDEIEG